MGCGSRFPHLQLVQLIRFGVGNFSGAFLLNRFTDEVSKKPLTLVRKGFIVQEVLDALKMDITQFVRIMGNIKKSIYQHQRDANQPASVPSVPTAAPTSVAPSTTGARAGAKAGRPSM